MLNVITRDRVVDSDSRRQINNDKVYNCERDFLPGDPPYVIHSLAS